MLSKQIVVCEVNQNTVKVIDNYYNKGIPRKVDYYYNKGIPRKVAAQPPGCSRLQLGKLRRAAEKTKQRKHREWKRYKRPRRD